MYMPLYCSYLLTRFLKKRMVLEKKIHNVYILILIFSAYLINL